MGCFMKQNSDLRFTRAVAVQYFQYFIWTSVVLLLAVTWETNSNGNWSKIWFISIRMMGLKRPSAKRQWSCLSLNVSVYECSTVSDATFLTPQWQVPIIYTISHMVISCFIHGLFTIIIGCGTTNIPTHSYNIHGSYDSFLFVYFNTDYTMKFTKILSALPGLWRWYGTSCNQSNMEVMISNYSFNNVPADDLAPLGARSSAGTVMTNFGLVTWWSHHRN